MKKIAFLYALAALLSASAYGQKQRYYKVIYSKDTLYLDKAGVMEFIGDEIDQHATPARRLRFVVIDVFLTPEQFKKRVRIGC